ncbi:hypothetical protein HYFRA_00003978 [Hymenoscyphus fraxineus]|uniref:Uncharacterized protein n=1 Tax=Hymenoscyphus fraxineus TaxID=746836 RepID=A0A9N9KL17_9HELO|nr:hypothetical protein HYFRA_00003978 [Hymenoscyphus fraxineus]
MSSQSTSLMERIPAEIRIMFWKLSGDGARIIEVGLGVSAQPPLPIGQLKTVCREAWEISQDGLVLCLDDEEYKDDGSVVKRTVWVKKEDVVFVPAPIRNPLTLVATPPRSYLWDVTDRLSDASLLTIETLAVDLNVVCNADFNRSVDLYRPLLLFRALKKVIIVTTGFTKSVTRPGAYGEPLGVKFGFSELDDVLPNRAQDPEARKLDRWLEVARDDIRRLSFGGDAWEKLPEVVMMAKTGRV